MQELGIFYLKRKLKYSSKKRSVAFTFICSYNSNLVRLERWVTSCCQTLFIRSRYNVSQNKHSESILTPPQLPRSAHVLQKQYWTPTGTPYFKRDAVLCAEQVQTKVTEICFLRTMPIKKKSRSKTYFFIIIDLF